jgi:hypothetical protein
VTTNLRPAPGSAHLRWTFDLDGIAEMYESYEASNMWELLRAPPQGLRVDFVRAARSSFRWEGGVVQQLQALGHRVHLLADAGHVVHQDNPGEAHHTARTRVCVFVCVCVCVCVWGGGGGGPHAPLAAAGAASLREWHAASPSLTQRRQATLLTRPSRVLPRAPPRRRPV